MATGKTRLEDSHKGKRKAVARVREDLIAEIDAKINVGQQQAQKCIIRQFKADPQNLTPVEQKYFDQIYSQLKEIYSEHARFALIAKHAAKIYALQQSLTEIMIQDGGPIITTPSGRLCAHPALKHIQTNHAMILSILKSMGLSPSTVSMCQEDDSKNSFTSEFAQFQ